MTITISGTSGVTYPAGGLANTAGAGVGTTDSQTLTNKTLTSPTITGASMSSMASSVITSGTAVASTSGTAIDFTGIPSWAKRVTVLFNQVSTSGTSQLLVRIGSGSIDATSYSSNALYSGGTLTDTTGYVVGGIGAGDFRSGACVLQLMGSNVWTAFGSLNVGTNVFVFGGIHTTGGALDRLRITPSNGTDTFDAGSINILYE